VWRRIGGRRFTVGQVVLASQVTCPRVRRTWLVKADENVHVCRDQRRLDDERLPGRTSQITPRVTRLSQSKVFDDGNRVKRDMKDKLRQIPEASVAVDGGHPVQNVKRPKWRDLRLKALPCLRLTTESMCMALAGFARARETVACNQPLAAYAQRRRDQGTSSWSG